MLLSDVCLSRTSGITREQRGLGSPKLAQGVAHVTRDSDTTFKVKGQGHQAGLLTAAFTHRQRSAWERIERGKLLLRCRLQARRCEALWRSHGEERGGAYRVATRTACLSCGSPRSSIMDCCTPAIEPTATFT